MLRKSAVTFTLMALITSMVVSGPATAAPANDDFAQGIPVVSPPFFFAQDTTGSSLEPHELQPCATEFQMGSTVWFRLSTPGPPQTPGPMTGGRLYETGVDIDTTGSDYDTAVAVWKPGAFGLEVLGCNDSFEGQDAARLLFGADHGTTYYIQVGGTDGATGNLSFRVQHALLGDIWKNAIPTTSPSAQVISNESFTLEAGEVADYCAPQEATVWYELNPSVIPWELKTLDLSTAGSSVDTVITLWVRPKRISNGALGNLGFLDCNDGPGNDSRVTFFAKHHHAEACYPITGCPPTHDLYYYIQIGTKGSRGPVNLSITPRI